MFASLWFSQLGRTPAVHLRSDHLNGFFEFQKGCSPDVGAKSYYRHLKAAVCKSIWLFYWGGRKKKTIKHFFSPNILYCSDPGCSAIQFTHSSKQQCDRYQKTSIQRVYMKTGSNVPPANSRWLLRGARDLFGPWEMLQRGEGKPCKNRVRCRKKPSTHWIAYSCPCNTLWFLLKKYQDETNDAAVILPSPRSHFRPLL